MSNMMSTENPVAQHLYDALVRVWQDTRSEDVLDLLEHAENTHGKYKRLTLDWVKDCIRILAKQ